MLIWKAFKDRKVLPYYRGPIPNTEFEPFSEKHNFRGASISQQSALADCGSLPTKWSNDPEALYRELRRKSGAYDKIQ